MKHSRFCAAVLALALAVLPACGTVSSTRSGGVEGAYQYPITPDSTEWAEFTSLDAKIAACAVDVALMEGMSTPALLETVLNYPLLLNILAFNTPDQGIQSVANYFPGLDLLFAREDALDCLAAYQVPGEDDEALVKELLLDALTNYARNGAQPRDPEQVSDLSFAVHMNGTTMSQPFRTTLEYPLAKLWINNDNGGNLIYTITRDSPCGEAVAEAQLDDQCLVYCTEDWGVGLFYLNLTSSKFGLTGQAACRIAETVEDLGSWYR